MPRTIKLNAAEKPLSARQQRFVEEYLVDHNAKRAAIRAGYKAGGSGRTAAVTACELMQRANVKRALDAALAAQCRRVQVRSDDVLRGLLNIAFADVGDAFNDDGTVKAVEAMPTGVRHAIASIEVEEKFEGRGTNQKLVGFVRKIRFWPKVDSLEKLGKHLRLFGDAAQQDPGQVALRIRALVGEMSKADAV